MEAKAERKHYHHLDLCRKEGKPRRQEKPEQMTGESRKALSSINTGRDNVDMSGESRKALSSNNTGRNNVDISGESRKALSSISTGQDIVDISGESRKALSRTTQAETMSTCRERAEKL